MLIWVDMIVSLWVNPVSVTSIVELISNLQWTGDALGALMKARMVDFGNKDVGTSPKLLSRLFSKQFSDSLRVDDIMAEARALAGPKDARTMVGVDVGGFRVIN